LQDVAFPGQPVGRSILGTPATVRSFNSKKLRAYLGRNYRGPDMVVAATGAVDHASVVAEVERRFAVFDGPAAPTPQPAHFGGGARIVPRDLEQAHIALALQGVAQRDPSLHSLQVFTNVLGGGMSSRLFQEIRERRGLVYTIASYASSYRDGGLFVVYAGMSPDAGPEVIRLTLEEIEKIRTTPVDAVELTRAKESLKGSLMLSLESTGSRMSILARSEIYYGRQITLDELIAKVDAVTADDVQQMAAELLEAPRLSMAAIGPFRADGALAKRMRDAFEGYVQAQAGV
jgi:predicted Zn-dependent peptidase